MVVMGEQRWVDPSGMGIEGDTRVKNVVRERGGASNEVEDAGS